MSPRKNNRPTIDEYFGMDAQSYGKSNWMARNQIKTTEIALKMLEDDRLGGQLLKPKEQLDVLDIGCGTGYSSHVILEHGFRVIGIDFSRDMLQQIQRVKNLHMINADMRAIPLRNNSVNHVISISAFNFATQGAKTKKDMIKKVESAFSDVKRVLRKCGRSIIEFYPTEFEKELFLNYLRKSSFDGGMEILHPNSKKEKKFLLLRIQ